MQLACDLCRIFPGQCNDVIAAEAAALCSRHDCCTLVQLRRRGGESADWCDEAGVSPECRRLVRMAALARPPPGPPPGTPPGCGAVTSDTQLLCEDLLELDPSSAQSEVNWVTETLARNGFSRAFHLIGAHVGDMHGFDGVAAPVGAQKASIARFLRLASE